jgi:hypothetical protein
MYTALETVASIRRNSPLLNLPMPTEFIRKMRGGSQSVLIRCSDNQLYIVKFSENEQGSNLLANEVIGHLLLRAVGLPTPSWRAIYFSEQFILQHPGMWSVSSRGLFPPKPGLHYGSLFVGQEGRSELFEILPGSYQNSISNKADFLGVYIFDVWANHCDTRQPIFRRVGQSRTLKAVFIDNGHLFGGPDWAFPGRRGRSLCIDPRVYPDIKRADIEAWVTRLRERLAPAIDLLPKSVPTLWYTGDLEALVAVMRYRLEILRSLFLEEFLVTERLFQLQRSEFCDARVQLCSSQRFLERNYHDGQTHASLAGG